MARKVRNSVLESRSNRLKMRVAKKPVFVRIGPGLSLGYRRNQTAGTWVVRVANGRGGARTAAIGFADDHDEADGQRFLDFWQAQERAKIVARRQGGAPGAEPLTVRSSVRPCVGSRIAWLKRAFTIVRTRLELSFDWRIRSGSSDLTTIEASHLSSMVLVKLMTDRSPKLGRKWRLRRPLVSAAVRGFLAVSQSK